MVQIELPGIAKKYSQDFDRFSILVYKPKPEYNKALLGTMVLGATALPDDAFKNDGSILGDMYLNNALLGQEPQYYEWQEITKESKSFTIHRGVDASPFAAVASVGTLSISVHNAHDPRSAYLYKGTPISVVDHYLQRILFYGKINTSRVEPFKDGTYTVGIEAVDAVSEVSEVYKYQETSIAPRPWYEVIQALLKEFKISIPRKTAAPLIDNIVKESSLAEYLDVIANTAGIYWYAHTDGSLRFITALDTSRKAALIGDTPLETYLPKIYLTDIQANFDTSKLISIVNVDNMRGRKSDTGDWKQNSTSFALENAQKIEQYGRNSINIEAAAANVEQLKARLNERLKTESALQIITTAGVNVDWDTPGYKDIMTEVLKLDLFDRVQSTFRNSSEESYISTIELEVTPRTFTARFNLTQV